jgi:alpha-beta hydrolase superfamily lysophospholipase
MKAMMLALGLYCFSLQAIVLEEHSFINRDNLSISTIYMRPDALRADNPVILWLHGGAAHCRRDLPVMKYMAERGISSLALDIRGHGLSQGQSVYIEKPDDWLNDIEDACLYYKSIIGENFFVVGRSAGALSGLFAACCPGRDIFKAGVFVAPSMAPHPRSFPFYKRIVINHVGKWWPRCAVPVKSKSDINSRDQKLIWEDKKDGLLPPYYSLGGIRCCFVIMSKVMEKSHTFSMPLHFICPGNDMVIDTEITKKFYERLPDGLTKSFTVFEGMRHSMFRDIGKEQVFEKIYQIIENHCS